MKSAEQQYSTVETGRLVKAGLTAAGLALVLSGCGGSGAGPASSISTEASPVPAPTITHSVLDACAPFTVYAQNRWDLLGAAVRDQPDVTLPNKGGFAGNTIISVDGYYDTGLPLDAHNPAPFNNGIWLHLTPGANNGQEGFVSYRGVRAETTVPDPDPTNNPPGDGGKPVVLRPECRIAALPPAVPVS
jgi:hypothetical protein